MSNEITANTIATQIRETVTKLLGEPASECPYFESHIKVVANELNTLADEVAPLTTSYGSDFLILKGLKRGMDFAPNKKPQE